MEGLQPRLGPLWAVFVLVTASMVPQRLSADAIVGSSFVRQARIHAQQKDYVTACRLMQKALDYRDTAIRRRLMARFCEGAKLLPAAVFHLRRAHALDPSREVVAELYRMQRLHAKREHDREVELEERRERELAEKQAEERRKRMAAIRAGASLGRGGSVASSDSGASSGSRTPGGPSSTGGGMVRPTLRPTLEAPDTATAVPVAIRPPESVTGAVVASNIDAFIDGLTSVSAFVRRRSALGIAESGRTDLAPRIAHLLKDDDPFVRMDAADALRILRAAKTVVPLLERLFEERNGSVQSHLVDAIEAEGSRTALNGLAQYRDYLQSGAPITGHVLAAIERLEEKLDR